MGSLVRVGHGSNWLTRISPRRAAPPPENLPGESGSLRSGRNLPPQGAYDGPLSSPGAKATLRGTRNRGEVCAAVGRATAQVQALRDYDRSTPPDSADAVHTGNEAGGIEPSAGASRVRVSRALTFCRDVAG